MKSLIKKVAKVVVRNSLKMKKKKLMSQKTEKFYPFAKKEERRLLEFRENIINLLGRNIIIIRGVGLFLQ